MQVKVTPPKLRPFIGGRLNRALVAVEESATVGSRASAVAALVHLNHNVLRSQPLVDTLRDAGSPLLPASPCFLRSEETHGCHDAPVAPHRAD